MPASQRPLGLFSDEDLTRRLHALSESEAKALASMKRSLHLDALFIRMLLGMDDGELHYMSLNSFPDEKLGYPEFIDEMHEYEGQVSEILDHISRLNRHWNDRTDGIVRTLTDHVTRYINENVVSYGRITFDLSRVNIIEDLPRFEIHSWQDAVSRLRPAALDGQVSELVHLAREASLGREPSEALEKLGEIAIAKVEIETKEEEVRKAVLAARSQEITWSDIGRALGVTPQAARRKYDPEARRLHSDYRRHSEDES